MPTGFYNIAGKIDELTVNYSLENLIQIESYFGNNNAIKEYFIRKISGLIDENFDPNPWFEPLYKKRYFDPKDNPHPKMGKTYYWEVLSILENIGKKNEKKLNKNMDILENVLDNIVNYKDENSERIENKLTDYMFTKIICYLPEEKIKSKYFEYIRTSLKHSSDTLVSREIREGLFPKSITSKELTLKLLEVIFDYKKSGYKYISIMDNYWFNDSLKQFKNNIYDLCEIEAADVALLKIKDITQLEPWQFNITSIEKHPQSTISDGFEYQLIYFVRDLLKRLNASKVQNTVKCLIEEDNSIFKRLAIHTINYHYKELNDIFWNLENPLNIYGLRNEISVLLKDNFDEFDESEYEILINWIENAEKEKTKSLDAYEKLRWIDLIKASENPKIQQLYIHYKKIYPEKINYPDFDSWHEETCLKPVKPIKLCDKSVEEIVEYLNNKNKTNEEGPQGSFKICVSQNAVKFSENLTLFLNVSIKGQNDLLNGLFQAWRNGNHFEWDNLLNFILAIIKLESFWNEYPTKGFSYYNEVIYSILFLIEERSKDDQYPFEKKVLPLICEILLIISENIKFEFDGVSNDIVLDVLNTPKGRLFNTMIHFSLSYARIYKNEENMKWLYPIKSNFEENLKNNTPIELPVVLGQFLPQIFYLDKEWAKENIELIFSPNHWKNAFNGYLFVSNKIYGDIYDLLKSKNYYDKALDITFANNEFNESLVNHICIAFLFDRENLKEPNSLINKLISNKDVNKLKEIIRFFLMQKDDNYELAKEKSILLWKSIFKIVFQNPEYYKEFIADIPRWILSFDENGDFMLNNRIFNYFMSSLKYISLHDFCIIPYLVSFVNKSPKNASQIFIEMINNGTAPKYGHNDDIRTIVQVLYKENFKEEANKISNYYGENGNYFLKELYFEHN